MILTVLSLLAFVIYSGLFDTLTPGAGPPYIKNAKICYKFGRGPYNREVGAFFTEVSSLAGDLPCIGIYYDDPKEVDIIIQR